MRKIESYGAWTRAFTALSEAEQRAYYLLDVIEELNEKR
jgi:hypothetical protein